eukprot:653302-Rhodomonas_salina.4
MLLSLGIEDHSTLALAAGFRIQGQGSALVLRFPLTGFKDSGLQTGVWCFLGGSGLRVQTDLRSLSEEGCFTPLDYQKPRDASHSCSMQGTRLGAGLRLPHSGLGFKVQR